MLRLYIPHKDFFVVLLLALVLRLVLAWNSPGAAYDIESYRIQGQAVLSGQNIYQVTYRYPYPPLWMYWPAIAIRLAEWTTLPFYFCVKLLAIGADLGIGWLLWRWPRSPTPSVGRAMLYLFNPIVLIITAMHGQFDALVIFMVLLAARWWIKRRLAPAAVSLGIGIALKGFPVLFLPAFLVGLASWSQAIVFSLLAGGVLLLISAPYLSQGGDRLLRIVLNYTSTADHGYSFLLNAQPTNTDKTAVPALTVLRLLSRWLELGAVLGLAVVSAVQHWLLENRLAATILAIYAVAPGLASQQMLWLIPFVIVTPYRAVYWIYTAVSTAALILFYAQFFPSVLGLSVGWTAAPLPAARIIVELGWWLTACAALSWVVYQQSSRRSTRQSAVQG